MSWEKFEAVYAMIGPAGVALLFVALFAIYLIVWQLCYMTAVWRNFRRDFLDRDHSDDIRAEVSYLFYRNFKRVSNGLCWLKLIAVVAPLMGLLGTVWGMVWVFQAMADVTHANAGVLASGIWSALITTIMGLCVAIPTLMAYYYLMLKFRGFHIEAVEHSYRALEVCRRLNLLSAAGAHAEAGCPAAHGAAEDCGGRAARPMSAARAASYAEEESEPNSL